MNPAISVRPRLLVVDDEPDINYLLKRGLSQAGFEVDSFVDPTQAIADYSPRAYAGIILDIRMPKMSGFELANRIWEKDQQARICFLTAYEQYRKEAEWALPPARSMCFLVKPMSVADVVGHLSRHWAGARFEYLCLALGRLGVNVDKLITFNPTERHLESLYGWITRKIQEVDGKQAGQNPFVKVICHWCGAENLPPAEKCTSCGLVLRQSSR